jgi:hypothetical protein
MFSLAAMSWRARTRLASDMDVQTDIGHVVKMLAANKPDDQVSPIELPSAGSMASLASRPLYRANAWMP